MRQAVSLVGLLLVGLLGAACSSSFKSDAVDETATAKNPIQSEQVIYGRDSVREVTGPSNARTDADRNLSASVALIESPNLKVSSDGSGRFNDKTVEERFRTCPGTKMGTEIAPAFCSGLLVGRDLVLTAGHCVRDEGSCESVKFVFGYDHGFVLHPDGKIPAKSIYSCKKIRALPPESADLDFALIQLDRAVENVKPVTLAPPSTKPAVGQDLYAIGYPIGTPEKTTRGLVRSVSDGAIVATLDLFHGNSGSPVFDAKTDQLVGVVSGGEDDFERSTKRLCQQIRQCTDNGCLGETVTPIDMILTYLKTTVATARKPDRGLEAVRKSGIPRLSTLE